MAPSQRLHPPCLEWSWYCRSDGCKPASSPFTPGLGNSSSWFIHGLPWNLFILHQLGEHLESLNTYYYQPATSASCGDEDWWWMRGWVWGKGRWAASRRPYVSFPRTALGKRLWPTGNLIKEMDIPQWICSLLVHLKLILKFYLM